MAELTEQVARANHGVPVEPELVIRRIRHWTLAGLLPTVGNARSGSGRHRRYPDAAVIIAAVLNSLAESNHSIGALTEVAKKIAFYASGGADTHGHQKDWKAALCGSEQVFLLIYGTYQSAPWNKSPDNKYSILMTNAETVRVVTSRYHGGSWVNLTTLFRHLNAPAGTYKQG